MKDFLGATIGKVRCKFFWNKFCRTGWGKADESLPTLLTFLAEKILEEYLKAKQVHTSY